MRWRMKCGNLLFWILNVIAKKKMCLRINKFRSWNINKLLLAFAIFNLRIFLYGKFNPKFAMLRQAIHCFRNFLLWISMYGIGMVKIYIINVFPVHYHDHWTSKWSFLLLIGCTIESSYYKWGSLRKNFWFNWVGLAMNTTCQEVG